MITVLDRLHVIDPDLLSPALFEFVMSDGQRWHMSLYTRGYIPSIGDEFHSREFFGNLYDVVSKSDLSFILDDNSELHERGL